MIASLGGQTAINLARPSDEPGREDHRHRTARPSTGPKTGTPFEKLLKELNIPQPKGRGRDQHRGRHRGGRPRSATPCWCVPASCWAAGPCRSWQTKNQLRHYLQTAVEIDEDKPVLVDKYIQGREVEIDAICDGRDVFVPGIMELVERTGVHSGDSISVYPPFSISDKVKGIILQYAKKLGLGIGIVGLFNIQFIVDQGRQRVYHRGQPPVLPYRPLPEQGHGLLPGRHRHRGDPGQEPEGAGHSSTSTPRRRSRWYVKAPVFSFNKIRGLDAYLSPEMKSTGEAIGYDRTLTRALYKALQASGMKLQNYGTVLATIADRDKEEALPLIRRFYQSGLQHRGHRRHCHIPEGERHPHPRPAENQRRQRGDSQRSAPGPHCLRHQHPRPRLRAAADGIQIRRICHGA